MLCARDDGDVLGYYTAIVQSAISQKTLPGGGNSTCPVKVKPFFHVTVGASAWGLSVHKEARMIAASANSHEIYIYAFALAGKALGDTRKVTWDSPNNFSDGSLLERLDCTQADDGHDYWENFVTDSFPSFPPLDPMEEWKEFGLQPYNWRRLFLRSRMQNWRVTLRRGHAHNIPCISFCNTGEDPQGKLLLSGDILGDVRLWDIDEATCTRVSHPRADALDFNNLINDCAIWNIEWIDRKAFRKTAHPSVALQFCTLWNEPRRCLVDITVNIDMVKNSGPWKVFGHTRGANHEESHGSSQQGSASSNFSIPEDVDSNSIPDASGSDDDASDSSGQDIASGPQLLGMASQQQTNISLDPLNWYVDLTRRRQWPSRTYEPRSCRFSQSYATQRMSRSKTEDAENDTTTAHAQQPNQPDDPLVVINPRSISLFQSSLSMTPAASGVKYPTIWIDNPLRQEMPEHWAHQFNAIDQMKLSVQIPDLGVLLVGSAAGRVAVFSLHQLHPNPFHEDPRRPVHTMRLDHILPLESQEHRNERPLTVLIGLSASPVQGHAHTIDADGGHEDVEASDNRSRRWRILMLYRDQTMLSYELTRVSRSHEARKAEVEELVVV